MPADLGNTQDSRNSRDHQGRVCNRCQGDEGDTIREHVDQIVGYLDCEPALARPSRAEEGDQLGLVRLEEVPHLLSLSRSTDEWGRWGRQRRSWHLGRMCAAPVLRSGQSVTIRHLEIQRVGQRLNGAGVRTLPPPALQRGDRLSAQASLLGQPLLCKPRAFPIPPQALSERRTVLCHHTGPLLSIRLHGDP
jgi:hypothetical protein